MQTKVYKQRDPEKLDQLMQKGKLGSLLQKVSLLQELNAALYNCVNATLRPHCQVVNIDFNTVIIGTRNSQVANSLFYQQNRILSALQQALPNLSLQVIRVRVSPHF